MIVVRLVLVLGLVSGLAACSSSPPRAAGRSVSPSPSASVAVSASPSPLRVGKVSPPVVRLFAGTQSVIGTPIKYCLRQQCVTGRGAPARLAVDESSIVTFALARTPERAVAVVSGTGGGRTALAPATLMAVPSRLAAGAHRVTLELSWADASGTWAFDLIAKPD